MAGAQVLCVLPAMLYAGDALQVLCCDPVAVHTAAHSLLSIL